MQRFLDFEVYPKWWLCVFGDYDDGELTEDIKRTFVAINSDMPNCRDLLVEQLIEQGYIMKGYNIKHYDLIIANAIHNGFDPPQVKIISDIIINPACAYDSKEHLRLQTFAKRKFTRCAYQDLMDDTSGSLKEKEMILGLSIVECDVPFDKEDLTDEDKEQITAYCKHDVYSTMYYYKRIKFAYTQTKMTISNVFNVPTTDCYKNTNAQLCGIVLGAKRRTYADEYQEDIVIPAKIREYVYSNLPVDIINKITSSKESFDVQLFNNTASFGNGGLHSVICNNMYIEENDEYALCNVDVASFYPAILIQFGFLSRSCTLGTRFKDIFDERIRIKSKPNKTKEDKEKQVSYKLVLNTAFGASGNKYLDMYDLYMCTSCCRIGQILLASLANKLYKYVPNLQIIQGNTDGLCLYYPRKYDYKVKEFTTEFSNITGFGLEFDNVKKMWQRDVNNYMWIDDSGVEKTRGQWLNVEPISEAYNALYALTGFACAKAAKEFLKNGKDIVETIFECREVGKFVISCNKGPTYRHVIQRNAYGDKILNKCNRVIATTDKSAGGLFKVKYYKDKVSYCKMPSTPDNCMLMNDDLNSYSFDALQEHIDYMWYVNKALDLIDIHWNTIIDNEVVQIDKFQY